jgi:hypothetical protein
MNKIQLTANIDGIEINKVKKSEGIEGFGSIFQMILNIISFIYSLKDEDNIDLKYYHNRVTNIGHKPKNLTSIEWDDILNKYMLTLIPNDILIKENSEVNFNIINLFKQDIIKLQNLKLTGEGLKLNSDIIKLNVKNFSTKHILDYYLPHIYKRLQLSYKNQCKLLTYFNKDVINISLHIRNLNENDVCLDREYFNKISYMKNYYIELIKTLQNYCKLVNTINKPLHFHIYSQGDREQFNDLIKDIKYTLHLDEDIITTLHHLIISDILVLSKSSFSAVANYYSQGINIMLENFWHKLTPNTIFSDRNGNFSYEQFKNLFNKFNNINKEMSWLSEINDKLLNKDGYLEIPSNITNIKISIGESYNAPYSEMWLRELPNRIVFGFEPNEISIKSILSGYHEHDKQFPNRLRLDKKYIENKNYILIPCALDLVETSGKLEERVFYSTKNDVGCSSLLKPRHEHWFDKEMKVKCIDLYSFLKLIPERFEYVEHVKIDAQGCDFRIIKSAKDLIKKIVFLTLECGNEATEYHCDKKDSGHVKKDIEFYMTEMGFKLVDSVLLYSNKKSEKNVIHYGSSEPNITFVNLKYLDLSKMLDSSLLIE